MISLPCTKCHGDAGYYVNPLAQLTAVQRVGLSSMASLLGGDAAHLVGSLDDGAQLAQFFGIVCPCCHTSGA